MTARPVSAPQAGVRSGLSEERTPNQDETMEEVAGRSASARDGSAEGKRGPGRPRKDANSAASAPLHAPHNGGAAERCPACKGRLEKLGTNRLQQPIQRCVSCHREFGRAGDGDVVRAPAASAVTASSAAPATAMSCVRLLRQLSPRVRPRRRRHLVGRVPSTAAPESSAVRRRVTAASVARDSSSSTCRSAAARSAVARSGAAA
jgi:uncharacterized protein (DUF983 family)